MISVNKNFQEIPPYYAFGLASTEFTFGALSWVAAFKYAIKITPPPLAATVSALIALTEFIVCKYVLKGVFLLERNSKFF